MCLLKLSFYCAPFCFVEKKQIGLVMSVNVTDEEVMMVEDCEGKETFHIYLLTMVYSLLAVSGSVGGAGWSKHADRSRFCRL